MKGVECKFSKDELKEIENLWSRRAMTQADIARKFNTSRQYIHKILRVTNKGYSTAPPGPKPISVKEITEKFHESYIVKHYECWESKEISKSGYGKIGKYSSHRLSWIIHYGDIPTDRSVLHRCDNRSCCNPNHLYLGTDADNALDRKAIRYYTGEMWLIEKLINAAEVSHKLISPTKLQIGKMFKISQMTLWRIRKSEQWPCRDGVYIFNWIN